MGGGGKADLMLPLETCDLICYQRSQIRNETINKEWEKKEREQGGEQVCDLLGGRRVLGFTSIIHDV